MLRSTGCSPGADARPLGEELEGCVRIEGSLASGLEDTLPVQFGPYVLVSHLGSGPMTEVFRGFFAGDPGQNPIVVKRALGEDGPVEDLLREEARIAGAIADDRVVKVLALKRVAGRLVIGLEYVPGADLAQIIHRVRRRQETFPPEIIVALLLQIARGLQALHEFVDPKTNQSEPVFHGDLKPANILVSLEGAVKIQNVGASQVGARDGRWGMGSACTEVARHPELRVQDPRWQPDLRSDLIALAMVGCELLGPQPLVQGPSTGSCDQLLNEETLLARVLASLTRQGPPGLSQLLTGLLQVPLEVPCQQARTVVAALAKLRDELRIHADVGRFVAPYLMLDPLEKPSQKASGWLPETAWNPHPDDSGLSFHPGDHLKPAVFSTVGHRRGTSTSRRPLDTNKQRSFRRHVWIAWSLVVWVAVAMGLLVWGWIPVEINIVATPESAMVHLQPTCEGSMEALQPAGFVLHWAGEWPLCIRFEAPEYMPLVLQVEAPAFFQKSTSIQASLLKQVCVEVASNPPGLAVYIDQVYQGLTLEKPITLCGLRPSQTHELQMQYNGERRDVQNIEGAPGEVLGVFHDFCETVSLRDSSGPSCERL